MNAHELDRVISRGLALIDAELTPLAPGQRQAVGLDLGQPHSSNALFFDRERANGAGGTDLAAIVAGRFTTSPIRNDPRRPKTLEALFETHRLQNIIRAGLKTFAAPNARLEKLLLRHTA